MLFNLKPIIVLTNSRLISTKAKNVSSKVTRILRTAQVKKSSIENKGKAAITATIKEKTEQANKALKIPSDHIWWSLWLLENSFKSLQRAYTIWYTNMSKYRIFRWITIIFSYFMWPIQKIIQIFAYFKFVRMLFIMVAFILGLFTDAKDLRTDLTSVGGVLALNLDTFLGFSLLKLQEIIEYLRSFLVETTVSDPQAFNTSMTFSVDVEEDKSWWSENKLRLIIGTTVVLIVVLSAYIYFNSDPSSSADAGMSASSSFKGKAIEHSSTFYEGFKNKLSYTWHYCKDSVVSTKDNLTDLITRVKTGDFSGSASNRAALKNSAELSVKTGTSFHPTPLDVATNRINTFGVSAISTPEHLPRNMPDVPSIKVISPTETGTSVESPGTIYSPPKSVTQQFVENLTNTNSNVDTNASSSNVGNNSAIFSSEISPSQMEAIHKISNAMANADQEVLARTTTDTITNTVQESAIQESAVQESVHNSIASSSSSSAHNSLVNSNVNSPEVFNSELPHNSVVNSNVNSPDNFTTQLPVDEASNLSSDVVVEGASNLTPPNSSSHLPTPDTSPTKPQPLNPSATIFTPRPRIYESIFGSNPETPRKFSLWESLDPKNNPNFSVEDKSSPLYSGVGL